MKKVVLCLVFGLAGLGGMVAAYNDTFPPLENEVGDDYSGPFRRMMQHRRMKQQQQNQNQKLNVEKGCTNTDR